MASMLMDQMIKRGFRVGLITWDPLDAFSHYKLNDAITWMKLGLGDPGMRASWQIRLKRHLVLRKFIKSFSPDVVIGFQAGVFFSARLASFGLRLPIIAAERNSPDLFRFRKHGNYSRKVTECILCTAQQITIQLESYRYEYPTYLHHKMVTIPNPVQPIEISSFPNERTSPPERIIHVGRLCRQKNQLFLLEAFSLIAAAHPKWVLTLVGEGEKRRDIEKFIAEKKVGIAFSN